MLEMKFFMKNWPLNVVFQELPILPEIFSRAFYQTSTSVHIGEFKWLYLYVFLRQLRLGLSKEISGLRSDPFQDVNHDMTTRSASFKTKLVGF